MTNSLDTAPVNHAISSLVRLFEKLPRSGRLDETIAEFLRWMSELTAESEAAASHWMLAISFPHLHCSKLYHFPSEPNSTIADDHCLLHEHGLHGNSGDALNRLTAKVPALTRAGMSCRWFPLLLEETHIASIGVCQNNSRTVSSAADSPPGLHSETLPIIAVLLQQALHREQSLWDEKLESLAEFAAGAGHEINNPLGTILGRVQMLLPKERDPDRRQSLTIIGGQAMRARDMIGDTMVFGRPPQPVPRIQSLSASVDAVLARFSDDFRRKQIAIAIDIASDTTLFADPAQFAVVLSELLRNALEATPTGGHLRITGTTLPSPVITRVERSVTELSLHNTGPQLTDIEQRHLFDPFFSGRQAGRGLGFGLSKCWRIVTQHNGCLHVKPEEDGVCFLVHFPLPMTTEKFS
ncbi:MAG: HAMP domain-containing sensor histidine kinase [Planctomycetaceae bacterium]